MVIQSGRESGHQGRGKDDRDVRARASALSPGKGPVRAAQRRSLGVTYRGPSGAEVLAGVCFLITLALYFLGAGRSLDYDSSITVGHFVATPSLLDPFRREHALNNHPLFSFLDHVVYSLGGTTETGLRALPIVCGAATVALVAWWSTRRWGLLAGGAAGSMLASNPMFAYNAREIRGYSLLALCAVVASIVFIQLAHRAEGRLEIAYVTALAVGVATHLYGLLLILAHAAAILGRHQLSRRWLARWFIAAAVGSLAYVGILAQMWAGRGGRGFHASFPIKLAESVLGSHPPAVAATALLVALAMWASRPIGRPTIAVVAALGAMITGVWLVVQPGYLFPRFFVWLVPAIAVLAARAVARWPLAVVFVATCVVSSVAYEAETWTQDPLPIRSAAHLLAAGASHGLEPCVLGFYGESLAAYRPPPFREVLRPQQLVGCGTALYWPGYGPQLGVQVLLPYRTDLPGKSSFVIYSRIPLAAAPGPG